MKWIHISQKHQQILVVVVPFKDVTNGQEEEMPELIIVSALLPIIGTAPASENKREIFARMPPFQTQLSLNLSLEVIETS